MKRHITVAAIALTLVGGGLFAATQTFAQSSDENPQSTLIQKIAEKFNLKTDDVKAVFDSEREEREAKRESEYEAQLAQYVTDGKITDAQKTLILAKHKEMQAKRQSSMENSKNMTAAERKAAFQAEKTALDAWAKDNSIDVSYLMPRGMKGGPGIRGPGHPKN